MSRSILDEVLAAARDDMPPRLDPVRARQMIDVAVTSGQTTSGDLSRFAWWRFALPAVVAVAVIVLVISLGRRDHEPIAAAIPPTELALPTGDRIVTTPGAVIDVVSATRERRTLRVGSGTALFDVPRLAAGEQFVVHTPDSEVTVVGTVFSVQVDTSTTVRVYEGHVRVRRGDLAFELSTGQQLDRSGVGTIAADPLFERGMALMRARLATRESVRDDVVASVPARVDRTPDRAIVDPAPSRKRTAPVPDSSPGAGSVDDHRPFEPLTEPQLSEGADRKRALALLAAGDFVAARDLAIARGFDLIEGDAHRALGAHRDAARAYERAITRRDDACIAALLAARIHNEKLAAPERALTLLASAIDPTCPTRERALALTIRIATQLKKPEHGREAAQRYLESFPSGDHAGAARSLLGR